MSMSEVTIGGWGDGIRLEEDDRRWRERSPLVSWWCDDEVLIYFPLDSRPHDAWISLFKIDEAMMMPDVAYLSLRLF